MLAIFLILFLGITFIVISTTRYKLHPFLALLITAYAVAIFAGIPLADISGIIAGGFGKTLTSIGLIIIAGRLV